MENRVTVTGREAYFNKGGRFFGDVHLYNITNREDAPYRKSLFVDDYGKVYADYGALFVWDSQVLDINSGIVSTINVGIVSTIDFGYNLSVSPRKSGIVTVTSYSTLWDDRSYVGLVTTVDFGHNLGLSSVSSGISTVTSYSTLWDDKSYVGLVTTIDFGHNLILTPESSGVSTVTSYVTVLDNNNLVGLVTSINFGSYLVVSSIESGIVTVNVGVDTGGGGGGGDIIFGGGGGESLWRKNTTGIDTSSNVGIGTTVLDVKFNVVGDSLFNGDVSVTGISSANKFYGDGIYVPTMYVAETPPVSAFPGNLWFDTNLGRTFVYYQDEDSFQWVDLSPPDPVLTVTVGDLPPTSPLVGNLWFSTQRGRTFVYIKDTDSGQWVDISPDGDSVDSNNQNLWNTNPLGIHTYSNVGIGTNLPNYQLTVGGVIGFSDTNIVIGDDTTGFSRQSDASHNIFLGSYSGYCNSTQSNNIFIGKDSGYWNAGDNNVYIGQCSGRSPSRIDLNTGSYNLFFGFSSGGNNTSGQNNVFLGTYSGYLNSSGTTNVFIGKCSGYYNQTGSANVFIGECSGASAGENGSCNNFIGYKAGYYNYAGNHNNFFGSYAGFENCGNANIFIGQRAGQNNRPGNYNIFFGQCAGFCNISGNSNTFIGEGTGYFNDYGCNNIFIGRKAGYANTTGYGNIFIGECSGHNSLISYSNLSLGNFAGYNNIEGYQNTFVGQSAGFYNTEGHDNAYFGNYTGKSQLASYKVLLGQGTAVQTFAPPDYFDYRYFDAFYPEKDKQLAIGVNISGTSEYWLVGDENLNIGIGTAVPSAKLDVVGDSKISGTVTAGYFVGDGSGLTNIPNIIASRWSPAAQGQAVGIWTSGNVGIGTIDPTSKLTIRGDVRVLGSGIVTATRFDGSVFNATTVNADLFAGSFVGDGSGITNLSMAGQWDYNVTGIHTFLNVGIGTTTSTNSLTLFGRQEFVGTNIKIGVTSSTTALYTVTPEERFNNFIGYRPGYNNVSGCGNNYLGYYAGTSSANATGSWNNFMGAWAGQYNYCGSGNNFFGYEAGRENTTGGYNNFFGECAGKRNTTGSYNTFFGRFTGSYNTTGSWNVFLGCSTGRCNLTGNENTFIGRDTGLYSTGSYNSFFGSFAGCNLRSGSYNVAIGYSAQLLDDYGSHQLTIGAGNSSWIVGNNEFFVGIGSTMPISKFTVYGDAHFSGIATFAKLYGDGSGLYNITATADPGLNIKNNGTFVGVAATLNFDGYFDASAVSSGIVTVSINQSIAQLFIWERNSAGVNTNSRVGLGTTTPKQELDVRGNAIISGVTTASTFNALSLISAPSATLANLNSTLANIYSVYGNDLFYVGLGTINILKGNSLNYGTGIITTFSSTNSSIANLSVSNTLVATGLVSFRSGPVIVGSSASTGTLNQKLQVDGGAYISGSIGVGTTNPIEKLHVIGNQVVSGFVSAAQFIGDGSGLTNVIASNADSLWGVTSAGIHTLSKVGIGTTNPTSQLTINGSLGFSDDSIRIGSQNTGAILVKNIGILNTLVGYEAACCLATGAYNSFFGAFSGRVTTTGCYNSFFGTNTGQSNTSGDSNSFFGFLSGRCNTTGFRNSFFGRSSGLFNTTGRTNSFFGFYSGVNNLAGCNNTFFGSFVGCSQNSSYKITIGSGQGSAYFDFPVVERSKTLAIGINSLGFNEYWLVGNERLNIGIGTTNPNSRLSVGGDVDVAGVVTSRRMSTGVISASQIDVTGVTTIGTDLIVNGGVNVSGVITAGIVTATQFFGDGSKLTGIVAEGSGVFVSDDDISFGVASTLNFGDNVSLTPIVSGVTTISVTNFWTSSTSGIITTGSIGIGTTLPRAALTVYGDAFISGVVTARAFFGDVGYARTAGIATVATNVIGGIANVTALNVTGISTFGSLSVGNVTTTGIITAGIVTATTFFGDGSKLTGISAGIASVSEYSKVSGIATISGISTNVIGGIASVTRLSVSGISTLGFITGTSAFFTGVVTATTFYGDGSQLTGIIGSQWETTSAGIHTLSNVGIGTTNPTSKLTVDGDGLFTGVVTATSFYGDGSQLTGIIAEGTGVSVFDSGSNIGIAVTLNFGENLSVTFDSGYATIDSVTGISTQWVTNNAGINTFSNVGIATTNPTSKLYVVGDAFISGVVTAGVVTATVFYGDGSKLSGIATAVTSDVANYAQRAGIATYATSAGVATYATTSGIATNVIGGVVSATQLSVSGISTLGNVNAGNGLFTGIVTALSFIGDGSQLSGVIAQSSQQWVTTPVGIHTLVNVGVGTTNPTSKLTVAGNLYVTGIITSTDYDSLSDKNLKSNIHSIKNPIESVKQIRGVTFNWKENGRSSAGVVAQEIEKVLPNLVNGDDVKTVNYNGLIGLLIECVKEQQKEIEELKKRLP